jgi:uncharacterized protein
MMHLLPLGTALWLGGSLASGIAAPEPTPTTSAWTVPVGLVERAFDPIDTDWRTLLGLNYLTGQTTPELESRRGKQVRIPGFMVPFEDGMSGVSEFLLVPYFGACIHTPPPPPNQIVYVRMQGDRRVEVNIWDAVYIEGILDIESIESPYGSVGHQVLGTAVKPYGRD